MISLIKVHSAIVILALLLVVVGNIRLKSMGVVNTRFDNSLFGWIQRVALILCPIVNIITLLSGILMNILTKEQVEKVLKIDGE